MPLLSELLSDVDALTRQVARELVDALGRKSAERAVHVYVPGRVEFLGKHTDYAGGRSLLMTVERGFRLVAAPRDDGHLRVLTGGDLQQFDFGQTPPHAPGHWVNYVATVARRAKMNFAEFVKLRGADIAFFSDLPVAAGMSSSSALMVATFLGLCAVNDLDQTPVYRREIGDSPLRLAEYLGCNENGQSYGSLAGEAGVGTFGGSEDHTAMLNCKPDTLSQFSFAPSAFERHIPFPAGVTVVIAGSGVEAVKTAAAKELYNRASLRARKAAAAYNRAAGASCRHLRDVALAVGPGGMGGAMEQIARGAAADEKDLDLPGRFEQFFREDQEIIPAVGDALARGELAPLGPLADQSHNLADYGLQNQVDETRFLQRSARELGAIAASYFGAGFGGSVWAVVEQAKAGAPKRDTSRLGAPADFAEQWKKTYLARFPARAARAEFFLTRPGPNAQVRE